ncbi:MAG: tetratricopeptide repeat protein [Elusimicrobia bacterium]|nr:tetratricopeptide repeat protein [Elusimicrobiota bacterium]
MSLKCPQCSYENADDASSCGMCGRTLDRSMAAPSAAPEAPVVPAAASPRFKFDYAKLAADAVRAFQRWGLVLDFSLASFASIDVFLDEFEGVAGKGGDDEKWKPEPGQGNMIMLLGVYCGETARRAFGGRWEEDRTANPLLSSVCLPGDNRVFFIGKVFKRFKNGSEDAVGPLLLHLRGKLGKEKPGPEELDGWVAQAAALDKLKLPGHALAMAEQALDIDPVCGAAMHVKGRCLLALGRPSEALDWLEKALLADPSPAVLSDKGRSLVLLGRSDEALSALQEAAKQAPDDPGPLCDLAESLGRLGRGEEALGVYDRAIALKPDRETASALKAAALIELKRFDEAVKTAEALLQRAPGSAAGLELKAQALFLLGRHADAIRASQQSLAIKRSADGWLLQGRIWEALGRWEEAAKAYDCGLQEKSASPALLACKARALERLDRDAEARATWTRLVELHPAGMDELLAEARRRMFGKTVDARKDAQEAEQALRERGFTPDYGPASLAAVDLCLGGALRVGKELRVAWVFGCYIGEVFVRELKARWEISPDDASQSAVVLPDGSRVKPMQVAKERFSAEVPFFVTAVFARQRGPMPAAEAPAWCELAGRIAGMGRVEEALLLYDEVLECLPDTAPAWLGKARLLRKSERHKAVECLDKALAADPGLAPAWEEGASMLVEDGLLEQAAESLDKALATGQASPAGWKTKADLMIRLKRPAPALEACEKVLAADASDAQVWLWKADLLSEQGEPKGAFGAYDKAVQLMTGAEGGAGLGALPADALRALSAMGSISEKEGRKLEALRLYQRLLGGQPAGEEEPYAQAAARVAVLEQDAQRWSQEARELAANGDMRGAARCLETATGLDPKDAKAWMEKAAAHGSLGEFTRALEAFDKALALEPENKDFCIDKAELLVRKGDLEAAIPLFEKAIDIDSQHVQAWHGKASALARLGRAEESLDACLKGLHEKPDFAPAWLLRAELEKGLGQRTEALASCRKFLKVAPAAMARERQTAQALAAELGGGPVPEPAAPASAAPPAAPGPQLQAGGGDADGQKRRQAGSWAEKAAEQMAAGRFEEAVASYDIAILLVPDDRLLWNGRGNALVMLGRFAFAAASYKRAFEVEPWFADAYYDHAKASESAGCREDAIRSYQEYLLREMSNRTRRAEVLARLKEWGAPRPDARPILEQIVARHGGGPGGRGPSTAAEWASFGESMIEAFDRPDLAVLASARALTLDARNVLAHHNTAVVLWRAGKLEQALEWFEKALALDKAFALAWWGKAAVEGMLGRKDRQKASLQELLRNAASLPKGRESLLKKAEEELKGLG